MNLLTVLFAIYLFFVVIRDGQQVAYKLWALYHDYLRIHWRPYQQFASNSVPPFAFMKRGKT